MKLSPRNIFEELDRRYLKAATKGDLFRAFPKQDAFIKSEARFLFAQCSRRAGKSNGLGERFLSTMKRHAKSTCLYLSLTRESAFEIMWPVMQELAEKHEAPCEFVESKLLVTYLPTGSRLRMMGADQKNFIKRIKGKKHPGIAVDEIQDFGSHAESLIDDVLTPCMTDYADSWLALTGTPGPIPAGYWYEVTEKGRFGYEGHRWTLFDNPYLPDPHAFVEELKRRREWPADHPTLLREWLNRWVLDLESLWIRYRKEKCDYLVLPSANWIYILGVDLGHEDSDALAVLAYHEYSRDTYLVHELVMPKQGITELVREIEALQKTFTFSRIVCDEGALGKKIAEEIRRQHKIPLEAADKARKQETVAFLNDAMRKGTFKARSNSRFVLDSYNIQIDRLKTTESKIVLKGPHSDIIDAVIYAFKLSPAYLFEAPKEPPKPGTKEWADEQEDDMFTQALKRAREQAKLARGPFDTDDDDDDWS